ncbi:MAG: sulfotransferase [Pseudomonadota bacterium]
MHIAMWSGPRNLSTAMMYSFGARADFDVVDEPFYGAYLALTGSDHPMRVETMASMECDPARVAQSMALRHDRHVYSKQMTHHMVPGIDRSWFPAARHVFLIRHPARVVASYAAKREKPVLEDLGFVQQAEIFEEVCALGQSPVVIDTHDIRRDPEKTLQQLCDALGLAWDPAMLRWPAGGYSADGVWAEHWYGAVHRSTGFSGAEGNLPLLEPDMMKIAEAGLPSYEALYALKI